jgi:hypothetical protein
MAHPYFLFHGKYILARSPPSAKITQVARPFRQRSLLRAAGFALKQRRERKAVLNSKAES